MAFELDDAGKVVGATGEILAKAGEATADLFEDWSAKDIAVAGGLIIGGGALLYLGKKLVDKLSD